MTTEVVTAPRHYPLHDALCLMREKRISCLIVADDDHPAGIVTEYDVLRAFSHQTLNQNGIVETIMSSPVKSMEPGLDIREAYTHMVQQTLRHIVVVDAEKRLLGIVSETDFMVHLEMEFFFDLRPVTKAMNHEYVRATPNMPLSQGLAEMASQRVNAILVEDAGHPIGILTERDAVALMLSDRDISHLTVGDVMTWPVLSVSAEENMFEVAQTMRTRQLRHVVVVSEDSQTVGMATVHDIIKGLQGNYVSYLEEVIRAKDQAIERAQRTEEQLRDTLDQLLKANTELERFTYLGSHDLLEPVRSLVSFSQLLGRQYGDKLDAQANEYLTYIVESSNHLRDLVRQLADFHDADHIACRFEPVDLNEVMSVVIESLAPAVRECGAEINVKALPTVQGRPVLLQQVFRHLIGNALKFRRSGVTAAITVSAFRSGLDEVIAVADNGIGIEERYQGDVFAMFRRLHPRELYPGTGMGLAFCRRIAEQHRGRIWLESTPGKGSTFYIAFSAPGDAED